MFITIQLQNDVEHVVEMEYLKSISKSGKRLEGAVVFARLFGILDDELFQKSLTPLVVNLALYDIYEAEWLLLYGFLRNGFIPYYTENKVNICYEVSLKLGGIPSFDKYFQETISQMYNPMTPVEDIKNKYTWNLKSIGCVLSSNESITIPYKHDLRCMYIRRKNPDFPLQLE